MLDIPSILKRAADNCGFVRNHWVEKDIPGNLSNITVFVFFGDMRSSYILSSMLLKRYRDQIKGSKYFIVCTWPGYEGLFPYVNEVWTIRDMAIVKNFFASTDNFNNTSDLSVHFTRGLNHWFEEVVGSDVFKDFYDGGVKQDFWDKFKNIRRYLVSVPSSTFLGDNFNIKLASRGGLKVFIYPSEQIRCWQQSKLVSIKCPKSFWVSLAEELVKSQITPVVYHNFATHDISMELGDRCIYNQEKDIAKVFSAMRAVGCVLDVFSGVSRWAMGARAPFLALDERSRYNSQKEYEIDDLLCARSLPRRYIFSFPTIIERGDFATWKSNFYDLIIAGLLPFISKLDRDSWPSPTESEEVVLYQNVRQKRLKKMGTRFIVVNRDLR